MYDFIVVGKGMMGSAAFRHLAERSANTLLIGPDEPVDPATHDGVFGAHYDEARLTHLHGKSPTWGELCRRSITRYRELEERSGIPFYQPIGELFVADAGMVNTYNARENIAYSREVLGVELMELDPPASAARFPYLRFPGDSHVLWEAQPAGYVNPRAMLRAQVRLGEQAGGQVKSEIVVATEEQSDHVVVRTREGNAYRGRRVLVATGAFANGFAQLPRKLSLVCKTEHVIFARVPESERERLHGLPVIHYDLRDDKLADLYLVPPVPYPDGHLYLKMGANTYRDRFLATVAEMQAWYRDGESDAMQAEMQAMVLRLFPGLVVESWHTGRCVITRTPNKLPMIDTMIPGKVYIAVGGNGSSAACADGIGELAANLVFHDGWRDELAADQFAALYA